MTTNGPQLQRINHFVRKVLADFPLPSQIAAQLIRKHVQPLSQVEFDPDTTLLATLEYNTDNPNTAFTAVVVQSMSLTEAMICNAPLPPAPWRHGQYHRFFHHGALFQYSQRAAAPDG